MTRRSRTDERDERLIAPSDRDAEEQFLSAILGLAASGGKRRDERLGEVLATVDAADFYRESHSQVFRAIERVHARGDMPDVLAVAAELEQHPGREADRADTRALIHGLAGLAAPTANIVQTALRVRDVGERLRIHRAGLLLIDRSRNGGVSAQDAARVRELLEPRAASGQQRATVDGATWALSAPQKVTAVWGHSYGPAWAAGEPLMLVAPEGVGKTTVQQQVMHARLGLRSEVLGMPVADDGRGVVGIMADRPGQARRSFARMVSPKDERVLRERLHIVHGPPPIDILADREALATWLVSLNAGTCFIDSLGAIAVDLPKDEVGSRINAAFTAVALAGIELWINHHQRKAQADNRKPVKLADVYGSRWLTSGMGSVLLLWGEPGDPVVELSHLKQPLEPLGPWTLVHDHAKGHTTVHDDFDLEHLVADRPEGIDVPTTAALMFASVKPSRNEIEKARRKLERLVAERKATRIETPGNVVYRALQEGE